LVVSLPASASAQRTFVSVTGVDNAACSLAAPCRTFAAAITATLPGGEVVVLDSGGYGAITVSQSVSIVAPAGVYAGISVLSGAGIVINAGASDKVVLRGLAINGQGGTTGIVFTAGGQLEIDRCVVSGMVGDGIQIGSATGAINIFDTAVERNGGHGIVFADYASGLKTGVLTSVRVVRNANHGLQVGAGGQVTVDNSLFYQNGNGIAAVSRASTGVWTSLDVSRSTVSANEYAGIRLVVGDSTSTQVLGKFVDNVISGHVIGIEVSVQPGATGNARATVTGNRISGTSGFAIVADGSNTAVVMNANVVTQSGTGVSIVNGAVVKSRGDNVVDGNLTNQSGPAVPANTM
jgi:hypothetical protein